jgi:hypothetical protein
MVSCGLNNEKFELWIQIRNLKMKKLRYHLKPSKRYKKLKSKKKRTTDISRLSKTKNTT